MKIWIINGPNLNLLGIREPEIYGNKGFEPFLQELREVFKGTEIGYYQSNIEGELVNMIQTVGFDPECRGIVLNAAAYSHTSIAIADAVKAVPAPVVGVHISNVLSREKERHHDLLGAYCVGGVQGLGFFGYKAALMYFLEGENAI
ncbi:MAG: type II 3-dehydroquinate dehydratase [Bacteroidia bacterium]|jgi:3-dehydroquinate dehydratase-2